MNICYLYHRACRDHRKPPRFLRLHWQRTSIPVTVTAVGSRKSQHVAPIQEVPQKNSTQGRVGLLNCGSCFDLTYFATGEFVPDVRFDCGSQRLVAIWLQLIDRFG